MTSNHNRCACSASFPSTELLAHHLAEIRSQERYHAAQLEQCRRHLIDDETDDGRCVDFVCDSGPGPTSKICPFPGCKRALPFSTNYKLWRHFGQHVRCEEVCVFCFKFFDLASDFVRHVEENHRTESGRKAEYMREMYEVSQRITSRLHPTRTASAKRPILGGSNKRTRDVAGMDKAESPSLRRKADALTTQASQCFTSIDSPPISASCPNAKADESALDPLLIDAGLASATSTSEVVGPGSSQKMDNTSERLGYQNPMQESAVGDPYDARILQIISSIPLTADFDWGEGASWREMLHEP